MTEVVKKRTLSKPLLEIDSEQTTPAISLHALTGANSLYAMLLEGRILGQTVANSLYTMLIDTGGSSNFLNSNLAHKLRLPINTSPFLVSVANGEQMRCDGRYLDVKLELPTYTITTSFYMLELEKLDMVLGIEWLRTVGPILWDFSSLTMSFGDRKKSVKLQGKSGAIGDLCSQKKFTETMKKRKQGSRNEPDLTPRQGSTLLGVIIGEAVSAIEVTLNQLLCTFSTTSGYATSEDAGL